ncbi:MAG: 16S rRNA (guanine(527)-N(7))-methyltransferase RsmG [Bryobacterales bacterium]|nr:16S rRNA (guanine(527)-N(7))-methyltransferase RsmG [Bryobacterales bacterium]
MSFAAELESLLPEDLPHRGNVAAKCAHHLELIVEINQVMNLTRILDPREAAIKHVLDSVLPWRHFEDADHIVDAGTGPGFPGIPLSLVLPHIRFSLLDATQKKARFVESVVAELRLPNVKVFPNRAEEWLHRNRADVVTGRAVAPLHKALAVFAPALKAGARVLLYKGPDADAEIAEAAGEARRRQIKCKVIERYELPGAAGARTLVEMSR